MKLKYYKIREDVKYPVFATDGSACFDIHAYLSEGNKIWAGLPKPVVTIYNMENKKEIRECKMWATHSHSFDVGIHLMPGDRALVPTGLIFNIPENHSVRIHTRSSISLKKGLILTNSEGIIDSDYYHQTFIMLYNSSADEVRIYHGDRIAQGELVQTYNYDLEQTDNIPEQKTTRVGGFGATGVK